MRKPSLSLLTLAIPLAASATSQVLAQAASPYAALDAYLDSVAAHDRAMGTLHILRGDSTVYSRAIGMASLEPPVPAAPDRRYRVGSVSKTFTAAVVLRLVEEGRLGLDDRIGGHFPDVPNADSITVRQLLGHRSGINSVTDDANYMQQSTRPVSRTEMLSWMATRPAVFSPGERFGYSNSNYILLTYLIEDVTGGSYDEALRRYVTGPFYSRDAPHSLKHVRGVRADDRQVNELLSYRWGGGEAGWLPMPVTDASIPLGAGAVSATAEDVARFYRGLLSGRLLGPERLAEMLTLGEGEQRMGLGIFGMDYDGHAGYGHTGSIDGFRAVASYFPADSLTLVYLENATRRGEHDVALAALQSSFGDEVTFPDFADVALAEVEHEASYLESLAGTYANADFPLDIAIRVEDGRLVGQATGQGPFPLTSLAGGVFAYEPAGIEMRFPEPGTMAFAQGALSMTFRRE